MDWLYQPVQRVDILAWLVGYFVVGKLGGLILLLAVEKLADRIR